MDSRSINQAPAKAGQIPTNSQHEAQKDASTFDHNTNGATVSEIEKGLHVDGQNDLDAKPPGRPKSRLERLKSALKIESRSDPIWNLFSTVDEVVKSLDEYPKGYGKLAAFQDADPSFLMARKFKWLHNRILLWRQDELVELEEELEAADNRDGKDDPDRLCSRQTDEQLSSFRKSMLTDIEAKLAAYDELLFRVQRINAIEQPTKRNQSSVVNFLNHHHCQNVSEGEWINLSHDLAALAPNPQDSFRAFLEGAMKFLSRPLTLFFLRSKSQRLRTGSSTELDLVSVERIDYVVNIAITILATAFLLFPISILSLMQSRGYSLASEIGVIFAFTLGFAAFCAVVAQAKKQEIFAVTAAFTGVLVVFLGTNLQSQSLQSSN